MNATTAVQAMNRSLAEMCQDSVFIVQALTPRKSNLSGQQVSFEEWRGCSAHTHTPCCTSFITTTQVVAPLHCQPRQHDQKLKNEKIFAFLGTIPLTKHSWFHEWKSMIANLIILAQHWWWSRLHNHCCMQMAQHAMNLPHTKNGAMWWLWRMFKSIDCCHHFQIPVLNCQQHFLVGEDIGTVGMQMLCGLITIFLHWISDFSWQDAQLRGCEEHMVASFKLDLWHSSSALTLMNGIITDWANQPSNTNTLHWWASLLASVFWHWCLMNGIIADWVD